MNEYRTGGISSSGRESRASRAEDRSSKESLCVFRRMQRGMGFGGVRRGEKDGEDEVVASP